MKGINILGYVNRYVWLCAGLIGGVGLLDLLAQAYC